MSNRVLTRFSRIVEVPQARFYTKISLNSGDSEKFGYAKATDGRAINFTVVEKSAVIKFDKHMASRVFSPDELENLDSYMMKYRKYGIVELLDNKLAGVAVSAADAFAEFGKGRVGGHAIGDFKVTNYMEKETTGLEVARGGAPGVRGHRTRVRGSGSARRYLMPIWPTTCSCSPPTARAATATTDEEPSARNTTASRRARTRSWVPCRNRTSRP